MSTSKTAKKLWALNGPTLTHDRGLLVPGETGDITFPVPAFLIEHERGMILFDTGLVPAAAKDPAGVYGEMAGEVGLDFRPEQSVDRQIQALGFALDDITHVVMSHAHWDHTGGMYLFPKARFFIGAGELPYAFWPFPAAPLFRREDIEPTRGFQWYEVSGDYDLFGDGSIVRLHMPGHTPGNGSLLVRLANQTIILAADTTHLRSGYAQDLPMPSDYSTLDAVHSIRRLKQLEASLDAMVWISHDPDDWARYRHAPEYYD
ncbi:N-acyl homoserine lactonase family protein [Sodalis ligni]|uniref:Glyoxylase-like metal-dependent hydrolase (Beta-lactamase superfamily II) n=1 Tax=Sodalis ligni TaxID=2697027 RepID=A0A4R1NI59_9GAMM|nr:N-acyl homoserine lactonase family protein [Sodalis ligni]TCL07445.1 glyoxylase-like metal-dependent hydrolase (beta-lactamase superfamily II) [Sodalis ligni]